MPYTLLLAVQVTETQCFEDVQQLKTLIPSYTRVIPKVMSNIA